MDILWRFYTIACIVSRVALEGNDDTVDFDIDFTGQGYMEVPTEMLRTKYKSISSIKLGKNSIKKIDRYSFPRETCNKVIYIDLSGNYIDEIHEDAFVNLPRLLVVDLSRNQLKTFPTLKIPSLKKLFIEANQVEEIRKESISPLKSLIHLELKSNKINTLSATIFSENKNLIYVSLSQNPLKYIDDKAFKGLHSLEILHLEETNIKRLPSKYGIQQIKKLYIKSNPNLFTIPNPENFKKIRIVEVTYAYHCCGFRGTRKQDSIFKNSRIIDCNTTVTPTELSKTTLEQKKRKRSSNSSWYDEMLKYFEESAEDDADEDVDPCSTEGIFIPGPPLDGNVMINCNPEPDAFTPCEDVMGTNVLRVFSWIISIFAIIGNTFQLIVLFYNRQELTIYKLLMYNLGFSNLLMGVYLIVLCCVDAHTYGQYYNYVQTWQYTGGCQALGFIAVFATQLSVCSLVLITVERFLLIIYALNVQRQMTLQLAKIAVTFSWLYSFVVALLPATNDVSTFNRTAICLPLDLSTGIAVGYIVWLLLAYIIAFIVILGCYIIIYRSINESSPGMQTRAIEIQAAKRMSLIIFSNFLCWLPISIAGFMALYRSFDFNVGVAKFLLVFFFPLNACTNPFLYVIFTKVFRDDTRSLLRSFAFFKQHVHEENKQGRAPLYLKSKKRRSNTITRHFLHIQEPTLTTYVQHSGDIIDVRTDFISPKIQNELFLSSYEGSCKLEPVTLLGSPKGLTETHRYRTESNETTSTRHSVLSEEEEFSKLIGSVQRHDPSILRV